jgi:hypothetical protein
MTPKFPLPLNLVRAADIPVWMLHREGAHIPAGENDLLNVIPCFANALIEGVRRVLPAEGAKSDCILTSVPYQDMSSARMKTMLGRALAPSAIRFSSESLFAPIAIGNGLK